jgi:hypothetical protein
VRLVVLVLAVAIAVIGVAAANFVLLGYGRTSDDRVGQLTPRIVGTITGTASVGSPASSSGHGSGSDDDHIEKPDDDD